MQRNLLTSRNGRASSENTARLKSMLSQGRRTEPPSHICALCRKAIQPGQRYLTLSFPQDTNAVLPNRGSSSSNASKNHGDRTIHGTGLDFHGDLGNNERRDRTREAFVSRKPALSAKSACATCHIFCLRCTECGESMARPPPGAAPDEIGILCDSQQAARVYREYVKQNRLKPDEFTVAHIFKDFISHAKCAERICAVCGKPIVPGESRVTLPRASLADVATVPKSLTGVLRHYGKSKQANKGKNNTAENEVYQHIGCTQCGTCGGFFTVEQAQSDEQHQRRSGRRDSTTQKRFECMLMDEKGVPHHPTCMACCCCGRPLFGGYEVHAFFGDHELCERALRDLPPLQALPQGMQAASLGVMEECSGGSINNSSFSRNRSSSSSRTTLFPSRSSARNATRGTGRSRLTKSSAQHQVTPQYGGLCCQWCRARVPRCISCERRCSVYTDASGKQFLPQPLTENAQRAAKLAAAISLGQVVPPASERSVDDEQSRAALTAAVSASGTGRNFLNGFSSNRGGGLKDDTAARRTSNLRSAPVKAILCGQCASLPLVKSEDDLLECVDWLLQIFEVEGILFTSEMVRLQQLMGEVKRKQSGNDKHEHNPKVVEKNWPVGVSAIHDRLRATSNVAIYNQTVGGSSHTAEKKQVRRKTVTLVPTSNAQATGKKNKSTVCLNAIKTLAQVKKFGLCVELVPFNVLNGDTNVRQTAFGASVSCLTKPRDPCFSKTIACGRSGLDLLISECVFGKNSCELAVSKAVEMNFSGTKSYNVALHATRTCAIKEPARVRDLNKPAMARIESYSDVTAKRIASNALSISGGSRSLRSVKRGVLHAVEGYFDDVHTKVLLGRCQVLEVHLVVAPEAASQFDKSMRSLRNQQLRNKTPGPATRAAKDRWQEKRHMTSSTSDVALKKQETAVKEDTFAAAAACAASVEGESEENSLTNLLEKREEHTDTKIAVAAGALLLGGSFAGGLVRTLSGRHAQGLRVRVVEKIVVVGAIPRILLLQNLAHELLHAFLACKQKEVASSRIEEGACNVAGAAALLRCGEELSSSRRDAEAIKRNLPREHMAGSLSSIGLDSTLHNGARATEIGLSISGPGTVTARNYNFESLLVRYRLWKLGESADVIYGEGYRQSLKAIHAGQFTFGDFVAWLLRKSTV